MCALGASSRAGPGPPARAAAAAAGARLAEGRGFPLAAGEATPVCPAPRAPRPRGSSVPWDPAVTRPGERGVAPRLPGALRGKGKKPRPCKNAARSFLVLVLLPAWMRAGHRLPLSIPSINPAAQLPRAELRLAGQRLRQSPVSKTGSSSGRGGCAPPVAPGGQTGTAKPRAALPRRAQGSAGLLPLGQPGWAVPASSVGCGTLPTCPRQCPPPGAGSGWGIQELSLGK